MIPTEFAQTHIWPWFCLGIPTYLPMSVRPTELSDPTTDSINLFNPTDLDLETFFDKAVQLNSDGVFFATKHWDGFCLWPSSTSIRNIARTPWYGLHGQTDITAEFVRHARMRNLKVALYFCVHDEQFQAVGSGTYTDWIVNQLTELLDGTYGTIEFIMLDGWGDTWSSGPSFTAVNYATVIAAIRALQPDITIIVNNHEAGTEGILHGDVSLWERPVDGLPPAGIVAFDAVGLADTLHPNATVGGTPFPQWFQHSDSPANTTAESEVALGRYYIARTEGYVYLPSFSPQPAGTFRADTLAMVNGMLYLDLDPLIQENFSLAATENAPTTLQTHTPWSKSFGSASVQLSPSGQAWIHDPTGATYYRNDYSAADYRVEVDFHFATLGDFYLNVMLRANTGGTADDRFSLQKSGSTQTYALAVSNGGLTNLASGTFAETFTTTDLYRLTIEKVGNAVHGGLWKKVDGVWLAYARRFGTSSANASGRPAFTMVDANGSAIAGLHVTAFNVYPIDTTPPLSPTLRAVDNETVGAHLAIDNLEPTIFTKIYKSIDNGRTYKIVGFTSEASWIDEDLGTSTALYKAKGIDSAWNASSYGNIVRMTGATGLLSAANGSKTVGEQLQDAGGAATTTVDNTKIVRARVRKLGTRADGVAAAYPDIKPKLGDLLPWWVDPTEFAGDDWPESVSDVATSDALAVAITMNGEVAKTGVSRELGLVWLTPVWTVDHETAEITFNLNYAGGRVVPVSMTANKPTR